VDKERDQLVSKVATKAGPTEIRVHIGEGIAGNVARNGAKLNIKDAYADTRFSPETDKRMGYTTRTILAMPIMDHANEIVAVTQVINKLNGTFTAEDEELLEYFSLFAGIALSNARLYEFVVDSGNKAMDLFNMAQGGGGAHKPNGSAANFFGLVPTAKELAEYETIALTDKEKTDVLTVHFNPHEYSLATDCHRRVVPLFVHLFQAAGLTDKYRIPVDVLERFFICCKKKYRMVPYHSVTHAFDVTQTLYLYLYQCGVKEKLTEFEAFILMVSGVLHDIDHMGLNNSFHFKAETPLGVLSAASGAQSVLEVHHCNLSIELLGISECDIFCNLTKDQKKEAYKCLIYNILATDMAKHKEFVDNFKAMSEEGYDKSNPEHRRLASALLLKCADISNVTKPFDISRLWGIAATEEFFVQGEAEKLNKVELTPAFQKEKGMELAQSQLGFINFMVAPMLGVCIDGVFTELEPFRATLKSNVAKWEQMLETHKKVDA
jgi:cAMP-specific phosphodiesterase